MSPLDAPSAPRLGEMLELFFAEHPQLTMVEDGKAIFYFSGATGAHYSLSDEHGRCVLQVWSDERNVVRRVTRVERKSGRLRLWVLRFGQMKPTLMELCPQNESRSPSTRKAERARYQSLLGRLAARDFPGWQLNRLTAAADLEYSFGPAYVRGLMKLGRRYFALLGVAAEESQATVDGSVSVAILWLDYCRQRVGDKGLVEGVALYLPTGRAAAAQLRLSYLDRDAAHWRLLEVDEDTESTREVECVPAANFQTRLVRCADEKAACARFQKSLEAMKQIAPRAEVVVLSTAEISFRIEGLEFARAEAAADTGFRVAERIIFGAAPAEYELNPQTEPLLRELVRQLTENRTQRQRLHPFYRMASESWLESVVRRELGRLDERLDPAWVYEQVPAFSSGDRAMIDLLGITRDGRLAVIELKADEDLHLAMQGLDYWARVRWHHRRNEFRQFGYFAGRELSPLDPILLLAAPALHVHTATDTLLRHLSPEIDWRLIALDEHWRDGLRVIWRKGPTDANPGTRA